MTITSCSLWDKSTTTANDAEQHYWQADYFKQNYPLQSLLIIQQLRGKAAIHGIGEICAKVWK